MVFLEILQNSEESTCARVSFLIKLHASVCNFIKKETLALVFSCEHCEIIENRLFYRTPPVAASESNKKNKRLHLFLRTPLDGCIWISFNKYLTKNICLFTIYHIFRDKHQTKWIMCAEADAGGCPCCQCSTPKWLTLISRVEFSIVKMWASL